MQRAQATISQPGNIEIQRRPNQLRGDDHTDQHADDPPDDRHDRELSNNFVVVG